MNSNPPTLYSYINCPFAMRARMALIISNTQCKLREVNLKFKPHELLLISPKATVPVLEFENGLVLTESYDIMRYALEQKDPDKWIECSEITMFLLKFDDDFMNVFRRYKSPETYIGESWKTNAELLLSTLETELYKHNGYLDLSGKFTLKDAVSLPMVYRLSLLDDSWWQSLPFSKVKTWLNRFTSSDLFIEVMAEHHVWHSDESEEFEEWLIAS